MKVQDMTVLIIDEENGHRRNRQRIKKILNGNNLSGKIKIYFWMGSELNLIQNPNLEELKDFIKRYNINVIIFDSLTRFLGSGQENSSDDVRLFYKNVKNIASANNCAVAIIHHLRKNSGK